MDSRKTYSYIKDEIVIELVQKQIQNLEKEKKSWIIEGFPRTRLQALALNKMHVIPDKLVLLNTRNDIILRKIHQNLASGEYHTQIQKD